MTKIFYIADPEILNVPIKECHEPLINIKNHSELAYGPPPECAATAPDYTKMRQSVFEKLCLAQAELPHGWRFRLYEGYRSLAVQQMLFDNEYQRVSQQNPTATHIERFHETTRLVSPVTNLDGSKNIPPHNTGAAVDVELITASGELVDMGMAAKDWCIVDPDLCLTHSTLVSETAKHNREILFKVLEKQGFVNYPNEWWHFSYGDRYWAYLQEQTHAIYGPLV